MSNNKHVAQRNLRFLEKRHKRSGMDVMEYADKLSAADAEWLERFARLYYDGAGPKCPARDEANHRRYMAAEADAFHIASPLTDELLAEIDGGQTDQPRQAKKVRNRGE